MSTTHLSSPSLSSVAAMGTGAKSLFRPFPLPQTRRQWFYLAVLQGVGAGFIDGGANFAIAYAMYHAQPSVKMWVFSESTIAGDLGVTPIVQCLASMLITSTLVHTDLHHRAIQPLPFVYPHVDHLPDPRTLFRGRRRRGDREAGPVEGKGGEKGAVNGNTQGGVGDVQPQRGWPSYYFLMLVRFIFEGTEKNMLAERVGVREWLFRFVWTAAQGAGIGIVFGFPLWCLAIVILGPIYGTRDMGAKWAPQAIKCIYGAIVGWVTNPVIATLALGSQADHHLVVVAAGTDQDEEAAAHGVIDTIPEEVAHGDGDGEDNAVLTIPTSGRRRPSTLVPTTPRSRSGTVSSRSPAASLRPPLTANVSCLGSLSPLPTTDADAADATAVTPGRRPTRARGLTVSSYVSSAGSFSYALGGTGGRARRTRSATLASYTATTPMLLSDTMRSAPADRPTFVALSSAVPAASSPSPLPSLGLFTLDRAGTETGFASSVPREEDARGKRSGMTGRSDESEVTPEGGGGAGWDVFGRTDVPTVTVERPSMDVSRIVGSTLDVD